MVLSDREIYKYILDGKLVFATPDRNLPFNIYEQVQPASVDLRLSNRILKFREDVKSFDVKDLDSVKDKIETIIVNKQSPITLQPNELIFCQTFENIKIPDSCIGIIEGKSRFARLGLAVHSTGSFINPDFEGVMPLQIINHNRIPITIYPFISFCQLILLEVRTIPLIPYPERTDNPYYREQIAGFSHLHKDSAINNDIIETNLIKLELEKRKIDNFIKALGYDQINSQTANHLTTNNSKNIEININGENIATVNLGRIIGNVNSNLEQLNTKGNYDITKSIKDLAETITLSNEINDEMKIEFAEYLKLLSEEAIKPREDRNYPVLKTIIKAFGSGLSHMANVAQIWDVYGSQIKHFFGL